MLNILSNLTKQTFNALDGAKFGLSEIFSMNMAFLAAVLKKVDAEKVKELQLQHVAQYGLKAVSVVLKNYQQALTQRSEIKKMLAEQPLFLEAAYMADDVYGSFRSKIPGGWKRSADFADLEYNDSDCALKSCLYERPRGSKKEYVYATAGTNPLNAEDWRNNFSQLYGNSVQYEKALSVATALSQRIRNTGATLMFVGHSLGGGEAINNAVVTGHKAIVFNPAGVSNDTKGRNALALSQNNVDGLVTSFLTVNDALNWLQDTSNEFDGMKDLVPRSEGRRYYLYKEGVFPIISHLMVTVIGAMQDIMNEDNLLDNDKLK